MIRAHTTRRTLLVGALTFTLTGCAVSDPSRYYALATRGAPARIPVAATAPTITIGVGPVTVPGYLERPQVVTRDANDGLLIWPYHRWAEPLDIGIAQALADDLGARLPSDRIAVFPWPGAMARVIDYQVAVAVVRLDGAPGRRITLDARWRLLGKGNKELVFKRSTLTESVPDGGVPAFVAAMNRAISGLGEEISQEIHSHSANRSATRD